MKLRITKTFKEVDRREPRFNAKTLEGIERLPGVLQDMFGWDVSKATEIAHRLYVAKVDLRL